MRTFTKFTYRNVYKNFSSNIKRCSPIIIIGAGTGGMAVSGQLTQQNIVKAKDITIFDNQKVHYYQPGFTKLGGGIIDDIEEIKYKTENITKEYNFQNEQVKRIDPDSNTVETENGDKWTYEHLIVAAGLNVKLDSIPGLKELLDDKNEFVGTIYHPDYVEKVKWMRENFKGGRALFTQPPAPLKCGGAPQKMAYLCEDYWRTNGVKSDIHFFTPLPQMFAVKYYSDTLYDIAISRGITPHFTTVLTGVKKGVATFKNTSTNEIFDEKYDFLHAVPHLTTPSFLHGSPIANAGGMVTIDATMRHKKYPNIWALGDCVDLPNAKTAAAVFSQAPVLVHNLECAILKVDNTPAKYDGYSSCPLFLKKGSLLLAEFKEYNDEKGNLVRELDESFHPGRQNVPRKLYYYVAYLFTKIYPLGFKGKWFGKHSVFKPEFKKTSKFDVRKLYKFIDYVPFVCGGLVLGYLII